VERGLKNKYIYGNMSNGALWRGAKFQEAIMSSLAGFASWRLKARHCF